MDISEGPLQRDVLLETQSSGLHRGTEALKKRSDFFRLPPLEGSVSDPGLALT